jgi:hypothetical protein
VSFAAIILFVASQRVIPKVTDSVRKLLVTPSNRSAPVSVCTFHIKVLFIYHEQKALLRILEAPGSILGQEAGYAQVAIMTPLNHSKQILGEYLKIRNDCSLPYR